MKRILTVLAAIMFTSAAASAQAQRLNLNDIVEMELLTSSELIEKIKAGKTSVLVAVGGTEIRGPHAVLGGHTILANRRAVGAAKKLGNALVAPVLPIAVGATGGSRETPTGDAAATAPGAIQMPEAVFKGVMLAQVESMVWNGFKDIFLMGDHGGGQAQMREVATEMDQKYSPKGVRVYYISDFYDKTHEDINMYMYTHKLPIAGHGAMMETSEMMYWEPFPNAFIRENFKTAPFRPTNEDPEAWKANRDAAIARAAAAAAGQPVAAPAGRGGGGRGGRGGGGNRGGGAAAPNTPTVEMYGLSGNPRPSTKAIGKDLADIGINNTVAEIQKQLKERRGASQQ